jgi:mRNA interferase HicA
VYDPGRVRGAEFVRTIQRLAKARGLKSEWVPYRGKGSHGTLFFGSRRTIVQDLKHELPPGTVRAMLRQLGLSPRDLE